MGAAGSGIAAVRQMKVELAVGSEIDTVETSPNRGPERFYHDKRTHTGVHARHPEDWQLLLKAQKALEAALLSGPDDQSCLQRSPLVSATGSRAASASGLEDRTRMECSVCGYKCVP